MVESEVDEEELDSLVLLSLMHLAGASIPVVLPWCWVDDGFLSSPPLGNSFPKLPLYGKERTVLLG